MFRDRREAGKLLASRLLELKLVDPVVLCLPRGGVPVGAEVAARLGNAPLDVVVARKIGAPGDPELAIGAVGPDGSIVLNERLARQLGVSDSYLDQVAADERREIDRRLRLCREGAGAVSVEGRTAIVVDDGIATGYTVIAALRYVRRLGPARLLLAAPVAPADVLSSLAGEADDVVVLATPHPFFAVGQFYEDFGQVTDQEVRALLRRFRPTPPCPRDRDDGPSS